MSLQEEVARLTGKLVFEVSSAPLQKFLGMLKTAENAMTRVGREAEALQKKLNLKLGITQAKDAKLKADAAVQQSLSKQLATEMKLSKLRRQQFAEGLAQQRLVSAGKREESFLQSAALKEQIAQAVLSSKQHKAQQEALKTQLGQAKLQASAEQSKIREARYADILARRQARTVQLQQQAAMHQTKLQRAEVALNNARASGIRQAERHQASKLATALREARVAAGTEQRAKRFDMATERHTWAAERHTAWQAKQAEKAAPESFDMMSLPKGLGAASAALYGLVKGVSYLSERIERRQEAASDNQQFDFTLMAAGKNDKERKRIREAYIANSQEYGMKIDKQSAIEYSNSIQGFRAQGKTLEQAIQLQKDQAAVFRIGNLDATQQASARLQLMQGYGKDRFMGQDLRPLTDALGMRLTNILYQAIGKALGYKGDPNKLAGFVLEAQHDGKVNGAMVQQGLRDIVAQSEELLERHKGSLDAQAARLDNDQYLQSENINKNPELIEALGDRITAERQLTEALSPLRESLMSMDTWLTQFNTKAIRWMIGRDKEGNEVSNAMKKDANPTPGSVGASLGPRLSPAAPDEQARLDDRAQPGLLNGLRRLFTGTTIEDDQAVAQDNKERWKGGHIDPVQRESFDVFKLKLSKLASQFEGVSDESNQWNQFRVPQLLSAEEAIAKATAVPTVYFPSPSNPSTAQPTDQASSNGGSVTNVYNVESPVSITVQPNPGVDAAQVADMVGERFHEEMSKVLRETGVNQQEVQ